MAVAQATLLGTLAIFPGMRSEQINPALLGKTSSFDAGLIRDLEG